MRFLLAFFALILAAGPTAEIHAQYIKGSAPQRIAYDHNGQIAVANTITVQKIATKEVQVHGEGGKTETRTVNECQLVPETLIWTHQVDELTAYTAARKAIEPDELLKRLENESLVYVCDPGFRANATFVSLLKPETICLFIHARQPSLAPPQADAPVPPQPKRTLPLRSQPTAGMAVIRADGKCIVRERSIMVMEQTAYRDVKTAQGIQKAPYSIRQTSTTDNVREMPASEVRGFDLAGQSISAEKLAASLTGETAVLISGDGQPIDPAFLENIKSGTLILALPQPAPLPTPPTMAPAVPGAVALVPGEV